MQKQIQWIKSNEAILTLLLATAVLLALHQLIFLYGDDYHYGTYVKLGFQGFWESHIHHYLRINGRAVVHFLVSLLLFFDIYLWRILSPLLIGFILFWMANIASTGNALRSRQTALMVLAAVLLFFSIPIEIGRESIYWLDGSMNYLYPMGMLFLAYSLYRRSFLDEKPLRALSALCFLAGATVEQAGLMTAGLLALECFYARFFLAKRLTFWRVLPPLTAIMGYATVALAPGTFVRGEVDSTSISLHGLYSITEFFLMDSSMLLFILLTSLTGICWLCRLSRRLYQENRKRAWALANGGLSLGLGCCVAVWGCLHMGWLTFNGNEKTFLLFFMIFALLLAYAFALVLYVQKDTRPLAFYLAAVGAQLMMAVAPVPRHRTLFCSVLALCIPIMIGVWEFRKTLAILALPVLLASGVWNISTIFTGYTANYSVNQYNLEQIRQLQADQLPYAVLQRMRDDRYCFTPLQTSNYHIAELVKYYGLPDNSVFLEPDPEAVQNYLYFNGDKIIMNFLPVLIEGQYFVSIGELAKAFAYETQWNELAKQVTLTRGADTIILTLGSREVLLNGRSILLDDAVMFRLNRNLVPISFFQKIFGYSADYLPNEFDGMDIMITG